MRPVLAAAMALAAMLCSVAPAAAVSRPSAPAVTTVVASPAAFVPDWDGHTDSTVLQYALARPSAVTLRVLDARGRQVATIERGRRSGGTHLAAWDGRTSSGDVLPAGTYRVQVAARPVRTARSAAAPGAAGRGGTVVVAGARATAVRLQSPPVAVRGVRLSRPAIGRSGRASSTTMQFDLSARASVSAAVVGRDSAVVRTLAVDTMSAGSNRLSWNGVGVDGRPVADGDYSLVIAARRSGRPTTTTRLPLRVDRTLPTLGLAGRLRARARTSGITVPVQVTLDEAATVRVRRGSHVVRRTLAAGSHRLRLSGASLGLAPSRHTRLVTLRVTVADSAGNAVSRLAQLQVPPVVRAAPPRPVQPPPQPPTDGGATLSWPIVGVVTSEFGPRGGRMHTGIDIGAPTGTPIHPVAPGHVSYVGVLGGYGNLVILEHAGGLRTYYAHMSRFGSFGVGEQVAPQDVIGAVGCTGTCSGPHIHFETRIGDVPRNPRGFLRSR